jgi:HK97 family phage major capsid protein
MLNGEEEIVMPRATNIPAGSPPDAPFTIPYLQQGADGVLGGIELNWTGEAKTVKDVKDSTFKDLTMTPQEVSGMATVNNKTLQNWEASGSFVQNILRQAWINGRDKKFLSGSGAGCPLGILNAPGVIEITRNTTAAFKYIDAVDMMSRMLPEALNGAIWTISITLLPDVATMKDDAGNLIFVQGDATKGIPATLLGLPIKWTGKTKTKGNRGDVMLTNFSYYLTKSGSGPYVAISEHVKFTSNQTVFKITANIDGQPWVRDSLTLEDGETTVSPYIVLK